MSAEFWLLLALTCAVYPVRAFAAPTVGSERGRPGGDSGRSGAPATHRAGHGSIDRVGDGSIDRAGDGSSDRAGASGGGKRLGGRAPADPARLERVAAIGGAVLVLLLWPSLAGLVGATAVLVAMPPVLGRINQQRRAATRLVDADTALLADLVAAVLRSGSPLTTALRQVAAAANPSLLTEEFAHVGGLLALGAEPTQAWARVAADAELADLARVACRSNESGIRLAESFERVAAQLRRQRAAMLQLRAERVGVWAVAPLGLCFLPAFLCLGIAPVVIGIGRVIFASVNS